MADVLAKIVADKHIEIAQREKDFPLSEFESSLLPSEKSFIEALSKPNAGFIFECKKASPSKGLIREDFDLPKIVSAYEKEAACFSVLTDYKYFKGRFEYLEYVTERVSQPVLNKDFFVLPYQIFLARYYNADAVLLMLSVLSDEEYRQLAKLTFSLGMEVLTEVSNEQETHRALSLNAKIIGINNRDLRDLSTDLATTERLVPIIRASNFDGVIISESGIYTHQDLLRLNSLVDGYLVGSSLMAQADLNKAVTTLVYGEVKICGITSTEDALAIAATQACHMGLIFAPDSPRYVSLEQAMSITQACPFSYVGVFVDAPITLVAEHATRLNFSAVQLHGNESFDYISSLRPLLSARCEIWNVQSVEQNDNADTITANLSKFDAVANAIDRWLFDCKIGNQSGGTGQIFNWRLLKDIPRDLNIVLAGGIDADNAVDAMQTRANCIDVNSGVETNTKGIKDISKIKAMFASLRI